MNYVRKPEPRFDIPIVPIGDIAFLLIIFFIMTSAFMREQYIKVTTPKSLEVKRLKESKVSVTVDAKGGIWLQGVACIIQNLEPGVTALLQDQENKVVMLKIDKGLAQKQYGPVLMALSKAGAELALVGTETKKQRPD